MKKIVINTIFLILSITTNAQQSKSEFHKAIDSINAILKTNQLAYYTNNIQNSAFIKKISVTEQGIVSFTDSIPKIENNTTNKPKLIPDYCPTKTIRTLDLFAIKKWDIYFPNAYLKDINNQTYGRIIGIRKTDLYKLKELFDTLTALCRKKNLNNQL